MIKKVSLFKCFCDGCGTYDSTASETELEMKREVLRRGWHEYRGLFYCPECIVYDVSSHKLLPKDRTTAKAFFNQICATLDFDTRQLLGESRNMDVVDKRKVCQYIMYKKGYTVSEIEKATNRHRSTVIYSINYADVWFRLPIVYKRQVSQIRKFINVI